MIDLRIFEALFNHIIHALKKNVYDTYFSPN